MVVSIEYPPDKLDIIKSAPGIFSFTIYRKDSALDNFIAGPKTSLYFFGLHAYLQLVSKSEWAGWAVVIHTDAATIERNPAAFAYFQEKGAIIGRITVAEPYTTFPTLLRIGRYYPMFVNTGGIVCVRDADTIFDAYLASMIFETTNYRAIDSFEKKLTYFGKPEFVGFINKLSVWERMYIEKVSPLSDKIVFTYDSKYTLDRIINTNKSQKFWTGTNAEYGRGSPPHVRLLAGIITKIGSPIDMSVWAALPEFTTKYFDSVPEENRIPSSTTLNSFDEYYLTDVIYKWAKQTGRVAFFRIDYVSPSYRSTEENVVRGGPDHVGAQKYYLENPGEQLDEESFNNPLRYAKKVANIPESAIHVGPILSWGAPAPAAPSNGRPPKPSWIPTFVFGGGSRRHRNRTRRTKKSTTLRRRRHKSRG